MLNVNPSEAESKRLSIFVNHRVLDNQGKFCSASPVWALAGDVLMPRGEPVGFEFDRDGRRILLSTHTLPRWGGDEFLMFLEGSEQDSGHMAQRPLHCLLRRWTCPKP